MKPLKVPFLSSAIVHWVFFLVLDEENFTEPKLK